MTGNPLRTLWLAGFLLLAGLPAAAAGAPLAIHATGAPPGSAVLELQASELVTMTPIPFRLRLQDQRGGPLVGARVDCEMTMPSMAMPENRPVVTARDGAYTGELIFTCAMGAWRMTCQIEAGDGSRRTAVFDIDQVRLK